MLIETIFRYRTCCSVRAGRRACLANIVSESYILGKRIGSIEMWECSVQDVGAIASSEASNIAAKHTSSVDG